MSDPEFSMRALQIIVNIERRLSRVTKKLITVGEQVSKDLLQVGVGKPAQYISIASESQRLNFISRMEARAALNIHMESPVVLWMARMAPVKNPLLALNVARLLPKVDFLMAGGGDLYDEIKDLAPPNVRLLSWVNPSEVIPAADIFLSTSLNEGVPYSLLEVISAGVPVVAVDSGAIAEIVIPGVNGILSSKNPNEIANLVSDLFSHPIQSLAVGQFAHNSSSLTAQTKKMAPDHVSLYTEILATNQLAFPTD
jgi:glycosyltransferase involved in cell wall biosynthesis